MFFLSPSLGARPRPQRVADERGGEGLGSESTLGPKWIQTSRLAIKNSFSLGSEREDFANPGKEGDRQRHPIVTETPEGPATCLSTSSSGPATSRTERVMSPSRRRYRGTSLIRKRPPPGPYSRAMPRALWWP